jgi:hypothetical protein
MTDRELIALDDAALLALWERLRKRFSRPWTSPALDGDRAAACLLASRKEAAARFTASLDAVADDPYAISDEDEELYTCIYDRLSHGHDVIVRASGCRVFFGRDDAPPLSAEELDSDGPLGPDENAPPTIRLPVGMARP